MPDLMDGQIGTPTGDGDIELNPVEERMLLTMLRKTYTDASQTSTSGWRKSEIIKDYLRGNQVRAQDGWATLTRRLTETAGETPADVDQEYFVDNLMLRIHMSNMQRFTRYTPAINIEPNSMNLEDKNASRLGCVALYDLLEKNDFKKLKKKAARVLSVHGHCYLKVYFDPMAGPEHYKPILDPLGKVVEWQRSGPAGQMVFDIVSPKNITLPPFTNDLDDTDWIQESNIRSCGYILRRYNYTVKPESIYTDSMSRYRRSSNSDEGSADSQNEAKNQQSVSLVHERQYRRCVQFPEGAIITWCQDKILSSRTLYDFYPDLTYFVADFIYDEEQVGGDTPYWHMIPYQDALNETEADIRRHVVMMCQPKYLVPAGTQINDEQIDNSTAVILRFEGNTPPGYMIPPALPTTVNEWVMMMINRMLSMGAAQDVIRPNRGRSGNAIAYEQEQDDTTLAPALESLEEMWRKGMGFALQGISQFYTIPRLIRMTDGVKSTVVEVFKGDDLRNNFNVRISLMNGLPANKLARQQYMMQLVDKKILSAQEARSFLEFGEADEVLRRIQIAVEAAEKAVKKIENGERIQLHVWDDHSVMSAFLTDALRERGDEMPVSIKKEFEQVLAWHQQGAALAQNPANGQAGPLPTDMGGIPGGGGPAGQGGMASGQEAPEAGGSPSSQTAAAQPPRSTILPVSSGRP